jgi:hypothetical protein
MRVGLQYRVKLDPDIGAIEVKINAALGPQVGLGCFSVGVGRCSWRRVCPRNRGFL